MERAQSVQVRSLSLLSGFLLLIVLVLVNVAAARTHLRVDLTEEKRFTLSDGSRRVLAQVQDPVRVQVFWHGIPTAFEDTRRYVEALLDEMADAASGRFQVTWVDVSNDAGRALAEEANVPEFPFGAIEGDEYRQSRGFMALVLAMGEGESTVLTPLSELREQLEYRIVADIQARLRVTPPVIALVTTLEGAADFATLGDALRASFGEGVRTGVTLSSPVPDDVQVVILAAPKNLADDETYHLEQFLLRGGRGIVLLDPVDVEIAQGQQGYRDSGLKDWFGHVGIDLPGGIVEDFERPGRFVASGAIVAYPPWVFAFPPEGSTNVLAASLPRVALRWPAPFRIDEAKQRETGRTVTPLLSSSSAAYRRPDTLGLMDRVDSPFGKSLGVETLAFLLEGPVVSMWKDKPLPKPPADENESGESDAGAEDPFDAPIDPGGDMPGAPGIPEAPDMPEDPDAPDAPDAPEEPAPPEDDDGRHGPRAPEDDAPAGPADEPAPPTDEPAPPADEPVVENREDHIDEGNVRLVVVGDADMVRDFWVPARNQQYVIHILSQLNGGVKGGYSVVLNAADWMSGSDDLLALRARADKPRVLTKVEPSDRKAIEWANLLAVPVLMLLVGIVVWIVRGSD